MAVDAAVGDDLDVAVGEQQVYENAAVLLGVPDPQVSEHFQRAFTGRYPAQDPRKRQRRLDREPHLSAVTSLTPRDRRLDPRQRGL